MARVTIEGSLTPCADLATGVRRTVEYTRQVRDRVRRGYYLIVSGPTEDDTAAVERLQRNPETLARLESVTEQDLDEAVEVVVHDHDPGTEPASALDLDDERHDANVVVPVPEPAGNASKVKWLVFLKDQRFEHEPGLSRDDLAALWRDRADGEG